MCKNLYKNDEGAARPSELFTSVLGFAMRLYSLSIRQVSADPRTQYPLLA